MTLLLMEKEWKEQMQTTKKLTEKWSKGECSKDREKEYVEL